MREFLAFGGSALFHGGLLVAMWQLDPAALLLEISIQSGRSVSTITLVASQAAATASQEPDTEITIASESVSVSIAKDGRPNEEPIRPDEPEIDNQPGEFIVPIRALGERRPSPEEPKPASQQDPAPRTLVRRTPEVHLSATASVASIPVSATSDFGASSDEPPRKLPGNPPPPYPAEALLNRVEGRVVLRVRVTNEGVVETAKIDTTSGHSSLDQAALATVLRWQFSPARRGGIAVAQEVLVPVSFSFRRS